MPLPSADVQPIHNVTSAGESWQVSPVQYLFYFWPVNFNRDMALLLTTITYCTSAAKDLGVVFPRNETPSQRRVIGIVIIGCS